MHAVSHGRTLLIGQDMADRFVDETRIVSQELGTRSFHSPRFSLCCSLSLLLHSLVDIRDGSFTFHLLGGDKLASVLKCQAVGTNQQRVREAVNMAPPNFAYFNYLLALL